MKPDNACLPDPHPVPRMAPPSSRAVRPLLAARHERMARWAEVIAADLPEREPSPAVLRQAVLRDLAWLCVYLREAAQQTAEAFEPARHALLDFLLEHAPESAPAWLEAPLGDLVVRWGYRVRLSPQVGDALNHLLQLVFLMGDSLGELDGSRYQPCEVVLTGCGEIDWACALVPDWAPALGPVRRRLRGEERD